MRSTRRDFVKVSAMAGAGLLLARRKAWAAFAQTRALQKFVQPMRLFGADIPVATPVQFPGGVSGAEPYGAAYYQIAMREFSDTLHPSLPPTKLWGYGNSADPVATFRHLGGAIIAQSGTPVRVRWSNELPPQHPLPVDMTVVDPYGPFPSGTESNRAAPHLHGGLVPWPSDGGPFHWFTSTFGGAARLVGPSVVNWLPDAGGVPTDDYWYPNDQSARFMWYHDHAVGITRLNAYAGLATGYIIQDAAEAVLMNQLGIPASRQIVLAVQDKIFNLDGSLYYPDFYDTQFFGLTPTATPLPTPSLVPEFWGDTMLVNGTAYPYFQVEPRRYRIRLLNSCNTRVLSLRLVHAQGTQFPANAEPDVKNPGPAMRVIGTEGGFLDGTVNPQGVLIGGTKQAAKKKDAVLVVAPGERFDLIIDFSTVVPGQFLILHNDAPVPYPGGTPLADFEPGNNKLAVPPAPGFGPNTRTLLQFQVVPLTGAGDPPVDPTWALPPYLPVGAPVVTKDLALYETIDAYGRLAQNLGTLAGFLEYKDPPTEVVQAGTVETWRIFNLTADTHPIHFHYFNVRVLSRQAFNMAGGIPNLVGKLIPPDPYEEGWKETVRMNPGECTTVLVELPPTTGLAPTGVTIPASPRLAAFGDSAVAGAEYVWHCHILEHEEHDMMRPLVVQG